MSQIKRKIEDTFLELLLHKNFNNIDINQVLKRTKISSKSFYKLYKTKEEIVISFFQRIDLTLEKKVNKIKLSKNIKDNLFEICMIKIDLLHPYKKNLEKFYLSFKKNPDLFIKLYKSFFNSIEHMLKLSLIDLDPAKKKLKILLFSSLYLSILFEWFKNPSDDNEKVMSILDQRLNLIENIII